VVVGWVGGTLVICVSSGLAALAASRQAFWLEKFQAEQLDPAFKLLSTNSEKWGGSWMNFSSNCPMFRDA
jgi:hypothetical protein